MLSDFKSEIKLFLIVAAVSAVLAVAGIFLLQVGLKPFSPAPVAQTLPPAASPQPLDTSGTPRDQAELDFAGWQTYRSEEFGFEVRYPKDWHMSKFEDRPLFFVLTNQEGVELYKEFEEREGLIKIEFIVTDDVAAWRSNLFALYNTPDINLTIEERVIGDHVAEKVTIEHSLLGTETGFTISQNNKGILLGGFVPVKCTEELDEGECKILHQILSTFRFVDSETSGQACHEYVVIGERVTSCATCGNGVCEVAEGCTASLCNEAGACTDDCGPLYCPEDCES